MIKLLEISFSDGNYGVAMVQPEHLKKEIQKYIERFGIESVFVNGKPYMGERVNYEM